MKCLESSIRPRREGAVEVGEGVQGVDAGPRCEVGEGVQVGVKVVHVGVGRGTFDSSAHVAKARSRSGISAHASMMMFAVCNGT